jgi:pimeloyl-ACP methyl ester carboxylesterase
VIGIGVRRSVSTATLAGAALLLLACSGDTEPDPRTGPDASEPASRVPESSPTGSLLSGRFDVGERDLFLSCTGAGEPTMILEVGEGTSSDSMDAIRAAYDSDLRVCSYDRANQGQSEAAPTPRTGDQVTADLHGLLEVAKVPGPYLLVGHSAGGLIVQAYAAAYPGEVAGVVVLNPVPPWQEWSNLGFREMTPEERQAETDYFAGANGESFDYRDISQQIDRLRVPRDIPFHLLISTVSQCDSPEDICGRSYPVYEKIMLNVSRQWKHGTFSQVDAQHEIYLADLDSVRGAIDDVLARVEVP